MPDHLKRRGSAKGPPTNRGRRPNKKTPATIGFAIRLEEIRKARSESQTTFAKTCGVTTTNMGRMLAGDLQPGLDVLHRIAVACDASLDWLVFGQGPMNRSQSRDQATLEQDLAAHVARSLADALADDPPQPAPCGPISRDLLEVDGAKLLAVAERRAIRDFRRWFNRVAKLIDREKAWEQRRLQEAEFFRLALEAVEGTEAYDRLIDAIPDHMQLLSPLSFASSNQFLLSLKRGESSTALTPLGRAHAFISGFAKHVAEQHSGRDPQ
jgi:transcriptional regulator with XRE-family HTH domain